MTSTHPEHNTSAATRHTLARYERDLYDARDLSMIPELLADPMIRHYAGGKVTTMTHDDCRARIGGFFDSYTRLAFRTVQLIVEDTMASWAYEIEMTANDGTKTAMSSIEVFEVIDGQITQVWNAEYTDGPWG